MHRRTLLRAGLGLAALGLIPSRTPLAVATDRATILLSAASDDAGRHFAVALDAEGQPRFRTALPGRAHAIVAHPDGRHALSVARRPGRFIVIVDLDDGRIVHTIDAAAERHFYGHAVFSADATTLYATENDYPGGQGRIGVYDASDGYRRRAEWHSGGIGPHELLREGDTLIVANGGLQTHPDHGRQTLNPDALRPALVWLGCADGQERARAEPPTEWRRASIRHIAALRDQWIAIAMQHQGDSRGQAPLVALAHPDHGMRLLHAPDDIQQRLRDYAGSVTADTTGQSFAVSAPRGNRILFWTADGRYLGDTRIADGCGLAAGDQPGEFLISDGHGGLHRHHALTGTTDTLTTGGNLRLDNHLTDAAVAGPYPAPHV